MLNDITKGFVIFFPVACFIIAVAQSLFLSIFLSVFHICFKYCATRLAIENCQYLSLLHMVIDITKAFLACFAADHSTIAIDMSVFF
jgi:hypothetical protein